MRALMAICLLLPMTTASLAQGESETRRYFTDWLAACRADGYCSATAYQNPNPDGVPVADYVLRVGRHAEGTYWEVSFTTIAAMADATAPVTVAVDDVAETFAGPAEIAPYGAVNDFFLLGDKAQAVMDRLAPGTEMTIGFEDTDGNRQQAEFSLSGLTASLIWIDEHQRRLGAERVAEAPPVGLDPVDAGSRPGGIPAALLAQHAADTECQPMSEIVNGADIETGTVGDSRPIYFLPCWGAAYNFGWKAYVEIFDGEFAVQPFPEYLPSRGWTATTHLVNYAFDPGAGTVHTFNKARGLGDCGTAGTWEWDEFAFRLIEFRAEEVCAEAVDETAPMGEFPVVYSLEEQ